MMIPHQVPSKLLPNVPGRWALYAVIAISTLFLGIWGGIPFEHSDELQQFGITSLHNSGNPGHFAYPAGWLSYLHGFVYVGVHEILWLIRSDEIAEVRSTVDLNKHLQHYVTSGTNSHHAFIGSIVTSMFGLLGAFVTFQLTYNLVKNITISFVAAMLLATSLIWVQDSHFGTVDVPFAVMSLATVCYFSYEIGKTRSTPILFWITLGILIGLTISIRYQGVVLVIPCLLFALTRVPNIRAYAATCTVLGVSAIIVFLVTNPYIILDFDLFWVSYTSMLVYAKSGGFNSSTSNAFLEHLNTSLLYGYGLIPLFLSLIGMVWYFIRHEHSTLTKMALLVYPLLTFLVISSSSLFHERYVLPLIPFLAVYSAIGVLVIYKMVSQFRPVAVLPLRWTFAVVFLLVVAALAGNVFKSAYSNHVMSRTDTREHFSDIFPSFPPAIKIVGTNWSSFQPINPENKKSLDSALEADVLILDTIHHDIYLHNLSNRNNNAAFDKLIDSLKGATVFQISPYNVPKEVVPYAHKSSYSPALPDLFFRSKPGPFIEIYFKNAIYASDFSAVCSQAENDCESVSKGYYTARQKQPDTRWSRITYSLGIPR